MISVITDKIGEIVFLLAWKAGLTYSPSRRVFYDGHGYSWLGKKIRRKHDIDPMGARDAFKRGFEKGRDDALSRSPAAIDKFD